MLSILILSQKGEGNELADKLVNEGNVVRFWVKDPTEYRPQTQPPWQEVNRYEEYLETTDLFLFTSSGCGGLAESLRERGKMVVGGSLQDVLVKPEVQDAAARLMCLPMVVPDKGVQASLCGWYDGQHWVTFLSHKYERMMEGERGPRLGMGCVVGVEESVLVNLTSMLNIQDYRGFVRVDVVLQPDQMYFRCINANHSSLEVVACCEALRCSLTNLLAGVARSKLRQPEYPQYGLSLKVLGFSPQALFTPPEAAIKHCWRTYDSHVIGYISAGGSTPIEARRRVYRTAANSTNIDTIYRRDVGCGSIFEGDSDAA